MLVVDPEKRISIEEVRLWLVVLRVVGILTTL